MTKLYMTELFKYRINLQPPKIDTANIQWYVHKNHYGNTWWYTSHSAKFEISNCTDAELYSVRNQNFADFENKKKEDFRYSEYEKKYGKKYPYTTNNYWLGVAAQTEIEKRTAVHPMLAEATSEEVEELFKRTAQQLVTKKLTGESESFKRQMILKDIELWRRTCQSASSQ